MQPFEQVKYYQDKAMFILKLSGALRFTCAPYLELALKQAIENKIDEIIFDMTAAKYIDSTMMGIIAKYFLHNKKPIIYYKDEDIKLMFSKIGFDQFFTFTKGDLSIKVNDESFKQFDNINESDDELKEYVLKAHSILSKLHPQDNAFKEVVKLLKDK